MNSFIVDQINSRSIEDPISCFCGKAKNGHLRCDYCGILAGPHHREAPELKRVKAQWMARKMAESGRGLFDLCESCQTVAVHGTLFDPSTKVRATNETRQSRT
jgi:hypothetical protein